MQNMEPDRIQQLIKAARDDERAKLAVESILNDIHRRLSALESALRENTKELKWIKGIIQANYSNINTLIQLMGALWKGDRSSLSEIQHKLAEQAFLEREGNVTFDVNAEGDVKLSADKVGRDKKKGSKDE